MSWFRRNRDDDGHHDDGHHGLGDGEAPGGWEGPGDLDGFDALEPDPFEEPVSRPPEPARADEPLAKSEQPPVPTGRGPVGAVVALVLALAVGLLADHTIGNGPAVAATSSPVAVPVLAPQGSLSSTWFCPPLGANAVGGAAGRIIIANPGGAPLHATARFTPSVGQPVTADAIVAPYTRKTYKLETVAPSAFTATMVTIDGDGGAVAHEIQGPAGESIAPCTTASSAHWYFASGRTDNGASMLLALDNPFPSPATVDLAFATDQGPSNPDAFQGLVIPAGSFIVVNVGLRVRARTAIATTISARSGRVVADKLEVQTGTGTAVQGSTPYRGLSLTLGDTAPATTWYYADGVKGDGITEHFDIYNPGQSEADISLAPSLETGAADPFLVTVPPQGRASVQIDKEARIPPGVGQAWSLTSTNNVPVVAERVYEELAPAPHVGVADAMGAPRTGSRWVFPAGSAVDGADEYLILFNPGGQKATVNVTASGTGTAQPLPGLAPLQLAPGTRTAVRIGAVLPSGGVVVLDVQSSTPIVAEQAQARVGGPGLSSVFGILGG